MRKITTNGEVYPSLLPRVRRRARQPVYSHRNKDYSKMLQLTGLIPRFNLGL
jgi:hypothetical protein